MARFGKPNVFKMYSLASLPLVLPFGLLLFLAVWAVAFTEVWNGGLSWGFVFGHLLDSLSVAVTISASAAMTALPFVVTAASLSNRWFRRSRVLANVIADVPQLLLVPIGALVLLHTGSGNGTLFLLLLFFNGSWFAHHSLTRMAATRHVTWQALQGMGATRWQIVQIVYLRQALHHTLDLVPFMVSRVLGQVLFIGIFAPHWHLAPASLWLGWTAAATPPPLSLTTAELLVLLTTSLILNYLAYRLSRRSWEVSPTLGHFCTAWSEYCE